MSDTEKETVCNVFKSNRGALKLFVEGFTYNRNRSRNENFYWCCELYHNNVYKCNATVKTIVDKDGKHTISKRTHNHNHGPDPLRKEIADFKEKLKNTSNSSDLKVCNIVQNAKSSEDQMVLEQLPSTSALKQIIYRQKSKCNTWSEEPKDVYFKLNEAETQIKGNNFVIKDKLFDNKKRILLLSTFELMKTLSESDFWLLDGTFKVSPIIFTQLYTIHGNVFMENKKTFPLLFCLSTHKDKRSYDVMMELILEYGSENDLDMKPKVCILDFEKAAILSLRSNFENIILHGCHFHFAQIINRRVQEFKLAKKYATDAVFNLEVRCLVALSFLKETDIPVYFQKFLESLEDEDTKTMANWFQENYIFGTVRSQPKYAPEFWSCHLINEMKIPRTQNSAEAWHHKINTLIGKQNPGTYALIKGLIKETICNLADIEKIRCGSPPQAKKKRYVDKDARINTIIQHQEEYSEINLLKCIAKNIKL